MGTLINRRTKELSDDDINQIADTYKSYKNDESLITFNSSLFTYQDIAGFCNAATIEEVKTLNYVVTPGRYVGLPDDEDDFNFEERFTGLKTELEKQIAEEDELNKRIKNNLIKIVYEPVIK